MSDKGTFQGPGGATHTFDLPLTEVFDDQLAKGDLKPVDEAAREYASERVDEVRASRLDASDGEPEPEPETEPEPEPEPEPAPAPTEEPPTTGPGSSRQAWANWARSKGVTVEDDDTRDDIIGKLGGADG